MRYIVAIVLAFPLITSCAHRHVAHRLAKELLDSVMHPDHSDTAETTIFYIKALLEDKKLSLEQSERVKKNLIHVLSKNILEQHYYCIGDIDCPRIYKINTYIDGTESLEQLKDTPHKYDDLTYKILKRKPSCPWHSLPFEEFVTEYCKARSKLKQRPHNPLIAKYV